MAKKQQSKLSYGPNMGLISGARAVAESEAMLESVDGTAFAQGLTSTVLAGIEAQKERNDKMDSYLDDLGGIENINKLEEGYNKDAVTQFLRNGRDEYARLAEQYERTKDRSIRDKMDAIKFSFSNLNTQLDALVGERKQYADAYDKKQLVTLENGDEIYTDMYTNRSQFNIESNGDLGFGSGDSYKKFKDVAGKWNVKNNIGETFTLEQNLNATTLGEAGKTFYRTDMKNLYSAKFKETGPEGIMVMAKTDLTGDNEYILPNGQKASSMSFESMWSQGILDDKFYKQIPKGTDSKWMYDKKNIDTLNNLISEYYTDVTESSYNQGKANYKPKGSGKNNTTTHSSGITDSVQLTNGQYMNVGTARTIKSNLETGTSFKWAGVDYKYADGKWQTLDGIVGDGTADDIVYNITNDQAFQGIKTENKTFVNIKGETVDSSQQEFAEGMASATPGLENVINMSTLSQDDNVVASNLNKVMPTAFSNSNPKGYKWDITRGFFGEGDFMRDAITLKDGQGNVVTYPSDHPEFANQPVGISLEEGDRENAIEYIDNVLETFGLSGNMKTTSASPASSGGGKLLDE